MFDPNDKKYDARAELEEGRYIALINLVYPQLSKSGNNMVVIEYKVIGRNGKGRKTNREYYLLTEEQDWKLAKVCRAVDVDKPFEPTSLKALTKYLHNQIAVINVELRDDKDKDGGKVQRPRVVSVEARTDEDTDELNELYGDEGSYPNADDNIPPKPKEDSGKGNQRSKPKDDDDDQPRRRKPADDDDDDAPPPRKKAAKDDDDDDDDAPAKPKPARETAKNDAEEKPRQRRSGRGVDDDDIPF